MGAVRATWVSERVKELVGGVGGRNVGERERSKRLKRGKMSEMATGIGPCSVELISITECRFEPAG